MSILPPNTDALWWFVAIAVIVIGGWYLERWYRSKGR